MIRAVLTDLDGTLADTLKSLRSVYHAFLESFGVSGSDEEFESLNGPSLPEVVAKLQKTHAIPGEGNALLDAYQSLVREKYLSELTFFPKTKEFLEDLRAQQLMVALVTSSPKELVDAILEDHRIKDLFHLVVTAENVKNSKPEPDIYVEALNYLEVEAHEAIAVEDSANGVRAATTAGIPTIHLVHHEEGEAFNPSLHRACIARASNYQEVLDVIKEHRQGV